MILSRELINFRFNWAARKIHKRLLQLGASEIYPRGEADQQHDEGFASKHSLPLDIRLTRRVDSMPASHHGLPILGTMF